ncbi:MAG: hypothetical protein ACI4HI_17050 [Lachnospiraceae bacterium]
MQENLLNDLKYASRLIHKTADLMQEISKLKSQLKKNVEYFDVSPKHILYTVLMVLAVGYVLCWTNITFPLMVVIDILVRDGNLTEFLTAVIVGGAIAYFTIKEHNKKCAKKNETIDQQNKSVNQKIDATLLELAKVQEEYAKNCASWFPKNYCCVAAVDSFIYNIENYRADNLKEAVNLYEEELHRRRMEDSQKKILDSQNAMLNNQRQMIDQQNYANILAQSSLNAQRDTNAQLADLRNRVNNARVDVYVHN